MGCPPRVRHCNGYRQTLRRERVHLKNSGRQLLPGIAEQSSKERHAVVDGFIARANMDCPIGEQRFVVCEIQIVDRRRAP